MLTIESQYHIQPTTVAEKIQHTSWVQINALAFHHNIDQYRSIIGNALFAPVIKSNAYGHGIELIGQLCQQNSNVDWICVVNVQEALMLRKQKITKPILVLSIIDDDLRIAITQNIDFVLYSWQTALTLNTLALSLNIKAYVHIKIDTGLSRLGALWHEAITFIRAVAQLPGIIIRGIFTHFADSESEDQSFCNLQIQRFKDVLMSLENEGISIPLRHTSCSAATGAQKKSHFNFVRAGIGIYGLWPSPENKTLTTQQYPTFSLQPVLTWKTRIIHMKTIAAGSFVGYDRTHQVTKDTTIATLPIGYWDGYDRGLSNKSFVMINGKLARQIGRVAMNLMMIDVTDIQARIDDEVILLGNQPGTTADDLASYCNTINYEIVTRINPLIPRVCI
jgi:alanine racemase